MWFGVLGPVEVQQDGRVLPVGSGRERFVLASLLLNVGRVTFVDKLVDDLWLRPPPSAKAQLHNMISNLRRRLGSRVIRSHPGGYSLELDQDQDEFDLLEFRELHSHARDALAGGELDAAEPLLARAMSLWRGPALANVADELAADERRALAEERLAAAEARLDVQLALGRHGEVIRALRALLTYHPYRESLHEKHMRALLGAGRRADALAHYRLTYQQFTDELGIEPGARLRDLEMSILRGDSPDQGLATTPRQLPPGALDLVGRDDLTAELTADLAAPRARVILLVGPAGVGKTALAVAAGRRSADAFPHGQLYADLGGSSDRPAEPHAVAARFLRAIGVAGARLPTDQAERIAFYRSQLAEKRILLVLDDAGSESQVRPLLPADDSSRVIVTSRRQLAALVGAARRTVPVLAERDSSELLRRVVGARAVAEPAATAEIGRLCGRLPLAVGVASARLSANPHWTLREFAERLAHVHRRLDELSVGDLDVRASITLSYVALRRESQRLFRLLGLLTGSSWPGWVVDALAGEPAGHILEDLVDVHLVEPAGRDVAGQCRYRQHDLVAEFAAERARAEDAECAQNEAMCRLLDGWLAMAKAADLGIPHDWPRAPEWGQLDWPDYAPPVCTSSPAAWFEAERHNLVRAVDDAVAWHQPRLAARLALSIGGFLGLRSYRDDWDRVLAAAIPHARHSGDRVLLTRLLGAQFMADLRRDRHAELADIAARQLALARDIGDPAEEVLALTNASRAANRRNRIQEAIELLELAVPMARRPGIPEPLLRGALGALAANIVYTGRAEQALPLYQEALALHHQSGSLRTALTCYHYGVALTRVDRLAEAAALLAEARVTSVRHGDGDLAAYVEQALADVEIRRRRLAAAARRLERSRQSHRRLGDRDGLAEAMRSSADLAAAEGSWREAIRWLHQAIDIWRGIDSKIEVAQTLTRLEHAYQAVGDNDQSAVSAAEASALLDDLDLDPSSCYLPTWYRHTRPHRSPLGRDSSS